MMRPGGGGRVSAGPLPGVDSSGLVAPVEKTLKLAICLFLDF
jgi:hypothetical protein